MFIFRVYPNKPATDQLRTTAFKNLIESWFTMNIILVS